MKHKSNIQSKSLTACLESAFIQRPSDITGEKVLQNITKTD